ncbi:MULTISPECIES: carbohydrate ABC transporter permease [Bifidobacterium]|uniref:Carbohydrate ABC transporter permease n=2 Tax=Bifidobacterium TaxID=1678 RepID=A0A556R9E3_9BIFI|nr:MULTISPECIES: carbohydrate ABC transporter permease [Bifidobacterium]MBI0065037.1 carbohydrate ABC transporter permease [Bifidobacterium polysaccharolyticum]MBI0087132.1 carbohydrate ABC transporter permease [Bifidobacterium sp. M0404]MBI0105461.1 carbohydrate ABC transporter permease [Bifidobacterium polysaccharolyticum]MBI0146308.1 carbohydrate ABC transporter permease [Bifidobacterium polysaccharolyticum]MBI0152933.1 carbohydrate ABC transporter permease [Bifidobacterium sp. M0399]
MSDAIDTSAGTLDGSHLIRRSKGEKVYNVFNIAFFVLFAFICTYPFYYLIINSISDNDASAAGDVNWFPQGFHLENYKAVFKLEGLGDAAMVSLGRTVIGTALTVMASAFLGFMFTQKKMWHRSFWYRFVIITMYFNAGLIPMFITMKNLGLTNNFWVYILPAIVQPFNIILVKTYIESIPSSLQEAAEVDGAGTMTVFRKIILPMCTPILATVAIFSAVGQWNSFQDTLLYMSDSKLYSLQYVLYLYINQAAALASSVKASGTGSALNAAAMATQQTPTSIRMTVAVIVVLPILFVYPFFQRYFVKGMMLGAVKG